MIFFFKYLKFTLCSVAVVVKLSVSETLLSKFLQALEGIFDMGYFINIDPIGI